MCKFQDILDDAIERLWDELEDIPFSEDKKGVLRLDVKWHKLSSGTSKEEIWKWFDDHHSKGINYLLNERDVK